MEGAILIVSTNVQICFKKFRVESKKSSFMNDTIYFRPLKAGMVNESLIVEVWHFKASNNNSKHNTMIKKMSNLPKLMKELAVTTTLTGKYNSELIGRCSIPLQVNN